MLKIPYKIGYKTFHLVVVFLTFFLQFCYIITKTCFTQECPPPPLPHPKLSLCRYILPLLALQDYVCETRSTTWVALIQVDLDCFWYMYNKYHFVYRGGWVGVTFPINSLMHYDQILPQYWNHESSLIYNLVVITDQQRVPWAENDTYKKDIVENQLILVIQESKLGKDWEH